jgi:hypothetical protein
MVEGNCRDIVMEDMGFDDSVEERTTNETEFAIDCCSSAASEGPGMRIIVRKSRVSMLKVRDGN